MEKRDDLPACLRTLDDEALAAVVVPTDDEFREAMRRSAEQYAEAMRRHHPRARWAR